jgi:hypothetical protein
LSFLCNQTFGAARTETTTYEQIRIVFTRRHHRHGVYRFFLPAARNNCDNYSTGSDPSVADAVQNAALQNNPWRGTKKSAEDGGLSV